MAPWISSLIVVILIAMYAFFTQRSKEGKWKEEWWQQGRLSNAKQAEGIITIVLNFDYLLYYVMLTLATCASTQQLEVRGELFTAKVRRSKESEEDDAANGCGRSCELPIGSLWGNSSRNSKAMFEIDWDEEVVKAQILAFHVPEDS
ncbi:hypothetical protein RJ641_001141 [Dillenia turbinata]|uniref:Uncharacterized protein n=1 Tax=Dillenia turbinata TaxID=194707 RepID=A0AAN8WJH5_9MAGN